MSWAKLTWLTLGKQKTASSFPPQSILHIFEKVHCKNEVKRKLSSNSFLKNLKISFSYPFFNLFCHFSHRKWHFFRKILIPKVVPESFLHHFVIVNWRSIVAADEEKRRGVEHIGYRWSICSIVGLFYH